MRRLVVQPSARKDLGEILRYMARQSGSTRIAVDFTGRLRARCRSLASRPGTLGRSRPGLGEEVRSFAFRGYIRGLCDGPGLFRVPAILEGRRGTKPSLTDSSDGILPA